MSAPINLTINGQAVTAAAGQTVMQAAAAAGIVIPGLCNHPHLAAQGSCRLCLVEIEKQRMLQPACTFPVAEGLVIRTESEKIRAARVFGLEMLFSERSHQCMICSKSGPAGETDCELQALAYQYGMDHWPYPPGGGGEGAGKVWPLDASRRTFVMDHSRCILCRRCVRACNEVAANHTLGVRERGARTMISADDDVTFADSSCISCGTCLQVCPTGALSDRRSAFMGRAADMTRSPSVCPGCAVGCRTQVFARDNQVLRVEGDWDGPSGGLLCSEGRFQVNGAKRIMWPRVRQDGRMIEVGWDDAIEFIAERLGKVERVAGLVSPRLPNEALATLRCFFDEVLESNELGLIYGAAPPLDIGQRATLKDLSAADCIVVIGADPIVQQKVAGYLIKRAVDAGAKLILVSDASSDLDAYAQQHLQLHDIAAHEASPFERLRNIYHLSGSGIATIRSAAESSHKTVVCYSHLLSLTVYNALRSLPPRVWFLPLVHGTNALGAAKLGLTERRVWGEALFAHIGDDPAVNEILMPEHEFTVVHAAYESTWTEKADVVLPALTWAEQAGHVTNMEASAVAINPVVTPAKSFYSEAHLLTRLSAKMGRGEVFKELANLTAHTMV